MKNTDSFSFKHLLQAIGPGLLLAGAAIGVSHLVQATRAGADYGFALIPILALACISKYPFLEFGPRFAAATGKNLVQGYRDMGSWAIVAFLMITFGTMFIIQAAVTSVSAGLAEQLFGFGFDMVTWSAILLAICVFLLFMGRYPGLDLTMKIIITLLTLLTLAAVVFAMGGGETPGEVIGESPSWWNAAGFAFVIAFMGWMPIPLDSAVWHSIWTRERERQTGHRATMREAIIDFNIGYIAAALIGFLFLSLGALVMFGSGVSFENNSVRFSAQLVELYSSTLGAWSAPLITIAAFITMFSTTLAVTDAFPRVLTQVRIHVVPKPIGDKDKSRFYNLMLISIPVVSVGVLIFFSGTFTAFIDLATVISFLSAPLLAWMNYRLVTSDQMPEHARPGKAMRLYCLASIAFLLIFCLAYIYIRIFI